MANQHTKKIQHPGHYSSSTSTGPKKKETQGSEKGKQINRCRTVDTDFDMNSGR